MTQFSTGSSTVSSLLKHHIAICGTCRRLKDACGNTATPPDLPDSSGSHKQQKVAVCTDGHLKSLCAAAELASALEHIEHCLRCQKSSKTCLNRHLLGHSTPRFTLPPVSIAPEEGIPLPTETKSRAEDGFNLSHSAAGDLRRPRSPQHAPRPRRSQKIQSTQGGIRRYMILMMKATLLLIAGFTWIALVTDERVLYGGVLIIGGLCIVVA